MKILVEVVLCILASAFTLYCTWDYVETLQSPYSLFSGFGMAWFYSKLSKILTEFLWKIVL